MKNTTTLFTYFGWFLFAILSVAIGLYPFTYFVIDRHFGLLGSKPAALLMDTAWNIGFYGHIIFGGLALLVGWIQFHAGIRHKHPTWHRRIGVFYVIAVAISGLCALYIGFFATGGWIAKSGFLGLGVVWLFFTSQAFLAARHRQFERHQYLMIYSYAACFAAVTLRLWMPVFIGGFGWDFIFAYRIIAWWCWVPNLLVAFWIVRWKQAITKAQATG